MAFVAIALVAAGVCILAAALVPLTKILALVPPGRLRNAWLVLEALIATFMAGYLAYLTFFPHPVTASADLVVPAVFFLGACFVWLVTALSLKTSLDVRRVALLERESITDPLTGIYNRRFLDRMLRREFARAKRHRLPLTVLLLDLDLFKRINDTHGHRVGDLVLKAFAGLLVRTVRESDIVCRLGGEEFVVIAPETNAAVGAALSERLRTAVENTPLLEASPEDRRGEVRVTASIGAASLSPGTPGAQALLDAADEALYRAKRMGRNRSLSAAGAQLGMLLACLVLQAAPAVAAHEPWATTVFPQDESKSWWDPQWWERGRLPTPANHEVGTRAASYRSGDAEVPVEIHAPREAGRFPVVVFLHGRRGIDELTRLVPLRLAARGFTVVAPDLYSGRFIDKFPVRHDPALEDDAAAAIDFALALPEARGQQRTCVVSHTRGGYYALKALVSKQRQSSAACYVSYYPHWQHPEAPEAMQVYQYAPEVDELRIPVLVFFGEHEQYQRYRPILAGIESLRKKKRDARVIVYPGVGRGFDFRPREVRTLADDLATQDSLQRAAAFMRGHLATK